MPSDVHSRLTERMSAYVEGELPAEEKSAVEQHLATCAECRETLDQFRGMTSKLAQLKKKAPQSFLPSIQNQIHTRSRGRFFQRRWMLFGRIPFEWISLVMIIAMLVYYIVTLQTSPTTVTPSP